MVCTTAEASVLYAKGSRRPKGETPGGPGSDVSISYIIDGKDGLKASVNSCGKRGTETRASCKSFFQ
ncbi:hypothetical protein PRBEI_2001611200 [Prionailurus iriomotensis]